MRSKIPRDLWFVFALPCSEFQVFKNRQITEYPPSFRHLGNSPGDDGIGGDLF
jgi:hypothetical protein